MTYAMLRAGSRRALTAVAFLLAPAALGAQALPPAAQLMEAYTKAVGGEEAWKKLPGMHTTGTYAVPSMGLSADFNIWGSRPAKSLMIVTIPGMGEMRQGFDGTTGWAIDPMQGARVLSGNELKAAQDEAGMDNSIRLPKNFTSVETVEKTTLGGKECYKVKLVWKSGRETFDCYSTADGMMVASVATQDSPMGSVEAVTLMSDYKAFGEIKVPTRMTISMMGMEQVLSINSIEFVAVEDAKFELPAEIKAMVKK